MIELQIGGAANDKEIAFSFAKETLDKLNNVHFSGFDTYLTRLQLIRIGFLLIFLLILFSTAIIYVFDKIQIEDLIKLQVEVGKWPQAQALAKQHPEYYSHSLTFTKF